MNPLTHSFRGFHRSMQMSRHQVIAFVEGSIDDPFFYGKLCESVFRSAGISYMICTAREITGLGGGKQKLLAFFGYLRRRSSLVDRFDGKTTLTVFFLDKDIDDIINTRRHSDHIIYTRYYDVHSHIFAEGDLVTAAAAAASMDIEVVRLWIVDSATWRHRVAEKWRDWVTICTFTSKRRMNCAYNYGLKSPINIPPHGSVDATARTHHMKILETLSGLAHPQFTKAYGRVARLIDKMYANSNHDLVFKGKWYVYFLEQEIWTMASGRAFNSNGLANRITSAIAVTLDFSRPWAEYFKIPLRSLAQNL